MRRKELGMSESTLANALGLTFQQVQKYEKGGTSRLQEISRILEVPVTYFFEAMPGRVEVPSTESPRSTSGIFWQPPKA
jgi:transcriptional regulator with XRE-family HTH domain